MFFQSRKSLYGPGLEVSVIATFGVSSEKRYRFPMGIELHSVVLPVEFSAAELFEIIHFFLMLGLLGHLDLSYVYPFQGLSVVVITLAAAIFLREKLNLRLTIGALLISAGIVLVSMS